MPRTERKKSRVLKRFIGVNVTEPEYAKIERVAKNEDRTLSFILRRFINSL